jgi:hypothetical protein
MYSNLVKFHKLGWNSTVTQAKKEALDNMAYPPLGSLEIWEHGMAVWNERIVPFDHAEMPCINVGYNGAPYESNNPLWSDGVNTFFIDVYCASAATEETEADTLAAYKLQKIIGKIRFILRHSYYRTLGFAPGFIGGTRIASIEIADPKATQDANGCVMGRLIFEVKETEDVTPLDPVDASNFMTTVTLFESDKGYVWSGDY